MLHVTEIEWPGLYVRMGHRQKVVVAPNLCILYTVVIGKLYFTMENIERVEKNNSLFFFHKIKMNVLH